MFQKIREIRIENGMTQVELAEASGVSRATIIGLESGKITNVYTDTLRHIADALGVTIDRIFFDQGV